MDNLLDLRGAEEPDDGEKIIISELIADKLKLLTIELNWIELKKNLQWW